MDTTIFCLVDRGGHVYVKEGARSFAEVAVGFGLNETECQEYSFDLITRQFSAHRAIPFCANAAHAYLADRLGTSERLMQFAADGHLSKDVLVNLLDLESRQPYLDACAVIEKKYTEECAAENDPCLESGCSIDQAAGEICLQPLVRAEIEYHKACADEWIKLFRRPRNRIDAWKN